QILSVDPYIEVFKKIRNMADELRSQGAEIGFIDVGGGFGIRYQNEELPDWSAYADYLEQEKGDYRVVMEPGRYIVGNAGLLLSRVLYRKQNHGKNFVIVDGAMNDFSRPVLYDAFHEIWSEFKREETIRGDLVGPVCETGDFFARDRDLPAAQAGDYLAIMDAGAYGFVASSNYNSRPRAAEVLVRGNRYRIVRERETPEDLIRGEANTSW
ncbi:MAG TPA: diaminopimelate decarboxylase, partial [Acidobacteriota bacterium]|nr:diaminopimelate decarboxylase [Acidobacteriota bacterium]